VKPKLYYRNKKEDPAQRFQIPSESDQTNAIDRYKPGQLDHWLNIEIVITSFLVPKIEKRVTK
jgi:hypothetical protein